MNNEKKNISVIGVGKLGLCLSLNLENSGFNILGCDLNKEYIKCLNEKTFISDEPKVTVLLQKSKNISFTDNIEECVIFSDVIFIMVATPSSEDGKYNHDQIEKVLNQIYSFGKQKNKKTIIIGCTTYPGYCETLVDKLKKLNYDLVYNPEFIAQGNIIDGQLYPDMVLIGESSKDSGNIVESIHSKVCLNNPTICRMSLTEAELTKLSINCLLNIFISFVPLGAYKLE